MDYKSGRYMLEQEDLDTIHKMEDVYREKIKDYSDHELASEFFSCRNHLASNESLKEDKDLAWSNIWRGRMRVCYSLSEVVRGIVFRETKAVMYTLNDSKDLIENILGEDITITISN